MTEVLFKVLIIGDPTVGKTSFVQRYVNNLFRRDYKMTIGGKYENGEVFTFCITQHYVQESMCIQHFY